MTESAPLPSLRSPGPSDAGWSYTKPRETDSARVEALESAGNPDELIQELVRALDRATGADEFRMGVDYHPDDSSAPRAIIQFKVGPALYDWFFNGRTGYRAQFWRSPEVGAQFNRSMTVKLAKVLAGRLPEKVDVRQIDVSFEDESRIVRDVGEELVSRDTILASLIPEPSKVWMCERLIQNKWGPLSNIGTFGLMGAFKLIIPKWKEARQGLGLRAPYPRADRAWLDLKGGFVHGTGHVTQPKDPAKRADQIHETGWT